MNCTVEVAGDVPDIAGWFSRVEGLLSRFDPASALSQLNAAAGQWTVVPPLLYEAVSLALDYAARTGGAFDPTVLGALEAAGYSRSYEFGQTAARPAVPAGRWTEVELNPALRAIRLPAGVRLDLGGIGKGLAVDGAVAKCPPGARVLVNAGGDLALRTAPGDAPLLIEVEDPYDLAHTLRTFRLYQGGVATSSTLGRRWGEGLHHIIDPRTGRPTDSGVAAATVVAGTAAQADVLAKACIVLGVQAGLKLLEQEHCGGILVTGRNDLVATPGMEAYVHAEP